MKQLLILAVGGALGTVARYGSTLFIEKFAIRPFPLGTIGINIIGSFLMGLIFVFILEKNHLEDIWRLPLMVGFLGAYTTFSTFALDTVKLLEQQHVLVAMIYILSSVLFTVLAIFLGMWLARQF